MNGLRGIISGTKQCAKLFHFLKVCHAVIRIAVNDKPKRDPLLASPSYAALLEKMALLIT